MVIYYDLVKLKFILVLAPCTNAMSPDIDNAVVTSSNNDDVDNLRSKDSPRWESNPQEDGFNNPTITVTVSEEDSFISDVTLERTQNIESIAVTVFNSDGIEVRFHEII